MNQEVMDDYYFQFILKKLKKDVIHSLNENDLIKNIENINEIITNEVNIYFRTNEITFKDKENEKIKQSKTHLYRDRTQYKYRLALYEEGEDMCKARIWNCGMGGQCSRKGIIDGFCKGHAEPKNGPGKEGWWLGTIDKPRPRKPVNHTGKLHKWIGEE